MARIFFGFILFCVTLSLNCFVHCRMLTSNSENYKTNLTHFSTEEQLYDAHAVDTMNTVTSEIYAQNPHRITTKDKVLSYLKSISGSKTITGVYIYNAGSNSDDGIKTIYRIAGVIPGIFVTQMPEHSAGVEAWQSFIQETIYNWNFGSFVYITWGLYENPLSYMETWRNDNETNLDSLFMKGGHLNNVWKKHLDLLAPYLQQLENSGVIPICDFLPWINVNWGHWNGRPGLNGSFKLYQITRDYLTRHHGLTSLIWTWNLHRDGDMTRLEDYWPGENYVDVVSVFMGRSQKLETKEYQKLLDVVGDKPISMDGIVTVPTTQLLKEQPRWTWFSAFGPLLNEISSNSNENINKTFNSVTSINRRNNDFFIGNYN